MAAIFPKIYEYIDSNPSKMKGLVFARSESQVETDINRWDIFTIKPLVVPGPLSLLLWHTDTMYPFSLETLQKSILREKVLELEERASGLGRRWSKKKVQDLLAGQINSGGTDKPSTILEEVLCELFHVQKIVINKQKKTVGFYPTDMRLWKSDRRVIFADEENRWVTEIAPGVTTTILSWITTKEDEGWTIQWPTAEGKFDELKAAVAKRQLDVHPLPGSPLGTKVKKDDWARVLGRAEAIESWAELNFKATQ